MARRQEFLFDEGRNRFDDYENNYGAGDFYGYNEDRVNLVFGAGGGGGGGRSGVVSTLNPVYTPPPPPRIEPILPPPPPPPKDLEEIVPPKPIEEGPPPMPIIGGCMDPTATNFNRNATYDNGKCRYPAPTPVPVVNDYNAPVRINIRLSGRGAVGGAATIMVDGRDVINTPNPLNFTEKELLSPKVITVKKSGYDAVQEYRVKTIQRTITTDIKPISEIIKPPPPPPREVPRLDELPRGGNRGGGRTGGGGGGSRGGGFTFLGEPLIDNGNFGFDNEYNTGNNRRFRGGGGNSFQNLL